MESIFFGKLNYTLQGKLTISVDSTPKKQRIKKVQNYFQNCTNLFFFKIKKKVSKKERKKERKKETNKQTNKGLTIKAGRIGKLFRQCIDVERTRSG